MTIPDTHYLECEAIKKLKAKYCRLMDNKQWAEWRDIFTDDFKGTFELPPNPASVFASPDELVETNQSILKDAKTVHQIFAPEITLNSDGSALGIWQQFDFVRMPRFAFKGYGNYKETYRKCADGQWRIATIHETRLLVEILDAS